MAPGFHEAPPLENVTLTLDRDFLETLHLSLSQKGRRQDAETLRKHVIENANPPPKVRRTVVNSTSTAYQEIQSLFESVIGNSDGHYDNSSVFGAFGRSLIEKVHDDDFPLSFEPSAYGINAKALSRWPGYSTEFENIKEQRANPAKRSRNFYENPRNTLRQNSRHPEVKIEPRAVNWL